MLSILFELLALLSQQGGKRLYWARGSLWDRGVRGPPDNLFCARGGSLMGLGEGAAFSRGQSRPFSSDESACA